MTAHCEHCGQALLTWTPRGCRTALHTWATKHGKPPAARDWRAGTPTHPSNTTICRLFGTWNTFLKTAGYPPGRQVGVVLDWTPAQILDACHIHYRQHGQKPKMRDWPRVANGCPSHRIVVRVFGSWDSMIRAAALHRVYLPLTLPTAALADVVRPHITAESQRQLAERAGLTERALYRILTGETERTKKTVADRLLVAIDRPDAWHIELAEYAA